MVQFYNEQFEVRRYCLYDLKIRSLFVRTLSEYLKNVGSISPKPNILLLSL